VSCALINIERDLADMCVCMSLPLKKEAAIRPHGLAKSPSGNEESINLYLRKSLLYRIGEQSLMSDKDTVLPCS